MHPLRQIAKIGYGLLIALLCLLGLPADAGAAPDHARDYTLCAESPLWSAGSNLFSAARPMLVRRLARSRTSSATLYRRSRHALAAGLPPLWSLQRCLSGEDHHANVLRLFPSGDACPTSSRAPPSW